jgi:hypothetical protein
MNRTRVKVHIAVSTLRDLVGLSVALASMGWVLFHLVGFFFRGYVLVGESNQFILVTEFILTTVGLTCFIMSLCERGSSLRNGRDTG